MANKAVFLDRDGTIIEDPGYLSDPAAVKLMPGAELALKSLMGAGFKLVVVTNQSGIARGMLTEETLEKIHAELRRQLSEHGVHLDGIFFCPFHPEGTVEQYALDSDLRKPKPGMLLKAAGQMDIDLESSWAVGDSPRDVEAGQRAGCRSIRLRSPGQQDQDGEEGSVQADYTVRNLVEAAKIIIRESGRHIAAAEAPRKHPRGASGATATAVPAEPGAPLPKEPGAEPGAEETRKEILRYVRQLAKQEETEEFSVLKMLGGAVQVLALLVFVNVMWRIASAGEELKTIAWALVAVFLQLLSIGLFAASRNR